ncbi:UNVERIFIED_CONTAM: hypothetical protein Slati_3077100 [Sesamum latifolium]|uniref:Uncharacterized protein n=1 Tax=Sesamum latifolium TaxID=2727402 RepID=A0AAW2UVM6_9LAMI
MASLEVSSATQEVKASAFTQGLLDGDFFKFLVKKPATKFDAFLARAAKYINIEDAQASKREGQGEKRKENKDEGPSKKSKTDFMDKKSAWQRVDMVYTPLTVPITQAHHMPLWTATENNFRQWQTVPGAKDTRMV